MARPKKYGNSKLSDAEVERLTVITNIRTAEAQKIQRAKILLLSTGGISNVNIAEKRDTHKSSDFVDFLNILDDKYDKEKKIKIVLDNHSSHTLKETRRYLE